MVKCPKCGEMLADDDKRCPKCGEKISKQKNNVFSTKIIAVIAIIVIIAIVGVLASGMLSGDTSTTADVDDKASQSVNEDSSNKTVHTNEYWASAKAEKFHLPDCEWAQKISDDNKIIYQSRDDAIADGKVPCGACNP